MAWECDYCGEEITDNEAEMNLGLCDNCVDYELRKR